MSAAIILSALLVFGPRADVDPEQVANRFASACVDGRWDDRQCPPLRTELEMQLHAALQELALAGRPLERAVLRQAATAGYAPLAVFALRRYGRLESDDDRAVVRQALMHPAAAVRTEARRMLTGDAASAGVLRWWRGPGDRTLSGLAADPPPDFAHLGLAAIAGSLHWQPMASGQGRYVFTTALAPDKVVAALAGGRQVHRGDTIGAKLGGAPPIDGADMQRRMMAAIASGDSAAMERIQREVAEFAQRATQAAQVAAITPVAEFEAQRDVRYFGGEPRRGGVAPVVAIGRDPAFAATVVIVRVAGAS